MILPLYFITETITLNLNNIKSIHLIKGCWLNEVTCEKGIWLNAIMIQLYVLTNFLDPIFNNNLIMIWPTNMMIVSAVSAALADTCRLNPCAIPSAFAYTLNCWLISVLGSTVMQPLVLLHSWSGNNFIQCERFHGWIDTDWKLMMFWAKKMITSECLSGDEGQQDITKSLVKCLIISFHYYCQIH